jgi:hypothetical protein
VALGVVGAGAGGDGGGDCGAGGGGAATGAGAQPTSASRTRWNLGHNRRRVTARNYHTSGADMSPFEIAMLVCFGASWPLSIRKAIRTHEVQGKSRLFLAVVATGYACGILHKLCWSLDWVIVLYATNLAMVLTDLTLVYRYRRG